MFRLFKNNRERKKSQIEFTDLDGNELKEGDIVMSHRYDLGECIIKVGEQGFEYESIESKKRVNWALMIDAATERQKVHKVEK